MERISASEMTFSSGNHGAWRVVCPPRKRAKNVVLSLASIAAGAALSLVSVGGVMHARTEGVGGLEMFVYSWLIPMAFIGLLLVVIGTKIGARLWLSEVLESDGSVISYRSEGPFWAELHFEEPAGSLLPIEEPAAPPEVDTARLRGPVRLEFDDPETGNTRDRLCFADATYAEHVRLARSVNSILEEA